MEKNICHAAFPFNNLGNEGRACTKMFPQNITNERCSDFSPATLVLSFCRRVNAHSSDWPAQQGQGLRQRQLCPQRGALRADWLLCGLFHPARNHGGDILPHHTGRAFFSCLCDCSSLQHASVVMSLLYCLHLCPLPFRCFRGRPQSSCMRQRLLPSSLCTHQQWEIHCSLHPAPSTFLRSIHLLLQTHKVNTYQDFTAPVCQQENLPLT